MGEKKDRGTLTIKEAQEYLYEALDGARFKTVEAFRTYLRRHESEAPKAFFIGGRKFFQRAALDAWLEGRIFTS